MSRTPGQSPARPRRSSMSANAPTMARRGSRVHFPDQDGVSPLEAGPHVAGPPQPDPAALPPARDVGWHMPVYNTNAYPPAGGLDGGSFEEFPIRRVSLIPFGPGDRSRAPQGTQDERRGSDESDKTLGDINESEEERYKKLSFSSYEHPYDINPPSNAHSGGAPLNDYGRPAGSGLRSAISFANDTAEMDSPADGQTLPRRQDDRARRRGVLGNLLELYRADHNDNRNDDGDENKDEHGQARPNLSRDMSRLNSDYESGYGGSFRRRRADSMASVGSQLLDPDDPLVTGTVLRSLDDEEDVKRNMLRQMDYRQRRKEKNKIRIEFNITSVINRHKFLLKLARALMTFGAPSHRVESQLVAAARIIEVDAEFIHLPGVIICSFGDPETKTSETHFVKCGGRLALGNLHKLHLVYRSVVHDEISARRATEQLEDLLNAPPLYPTLFRCALAFCLSALICPLAFGGSFLDMWIAGAGAFVLCALQVAVSTKSAMYANVFEITIAILMSFAARGLSSIRSEIFCYTAISSSGIIGILPGYLILSSSLELASKNIVCGSVKMVYALIYTLFLGFGLQIGSDLYLLFDTSSRHNLQVLATSMANTVTLSGSFLTDNGTTSNNSLPIQGTFTFTNSTPIIQEHIIEGCYRPDGFPWYLQPFPFWTQFLIVPTFSILSSLANLQPFRSKQLPVMVVISCLSYAANKTANHYIFNRSDIVSAIGAFTVGVLGNAYSRKMGGTAFTSMVTGVLFLVPSGLSQAGGITANGSGIEIGGAMISVTIGITVGLFMSQALVYTFGNRKSAAVFSF